MTYIAILFIFLMPTFVLYKFGPEWADDKKKREIYNMWHQRELKDPADVV